MMNLQNLQEKRGMLLMTKITQNMGKKLFEKFKLFETKVIKSSLCDYSGEYRLVTGDITAAGGNNITRVAFKNWAPFRSCVTHINDEHIDTAENLDIMPMYNLIEYSDNYSDTSVSSWQFRRDKQNMNNGNRADVTTNDQHILNTNQLF